MRMKLKIEGADALKALMFDIGKAGEEAVEAAVSEIADQIVDAGKAGMTSGSGPSAPGQYPHRDSGELAGSVRKVLPKAGTALVGTDEPKGYWLEFGTASMEPRPWLMPSFNEGVSSATDKLRQEFEARLK